VGEEARKRLRALVEFSSLGAGFAIAMRDLEIRGAGNILGREQSGHIAAIGYDMYCRLLEKCVREIKKQPSAQPVDVEIDVAIQAHVADGYVSREAEKLEIYRRVSQLTDAGALEDMREEIADRYGPPPAEVLRLLDVQKLRVLCRDVGVDYVGFEDGNIILRGVESKMQALLADCPRRVVVLDYRTVAIPFHAGRQRPASIDPDELFEFVLEWLDTKTFPEMRPAVRKKLAEREMRS
jgi:transcription-repair coupling factor (superfamily II helicase)